VDSTLRTDRQPTETAAEPDGEGMDAFDADALAAAAFHPELVPILPVEPIVGPAEVVAAVSPDSSYRLVKAAMDAATETLDLYIYNISAPYLIALVEAAIVRGVAVRIMYDPNDTNGEEKAKLEALELRGADVRKSPSTKTRRVFTVCHQKFVVVDREAVLIESANWAESSIPKLELPGKYKKANREWLVLIRSAAAAEWFASLFQADWDIPEMPGPDTLGIPEGFEGPSIMAPTFLAKLPDKLFDLQLFAAAGPITITPAISPQNYEAVLLSLIQSATASVDVQQQYIVDKGGATGRLLDALAARKDELEIRFMASPAFRKTGQEDNWEKSVKAVESRGMEGRIRAQNLKFFTHLHNKGVIVDRKTVVISSTNWSDNSIERAREAGVAIESAGIAGYFAAVFDFDWDNGWDAADVPANLAELAADALFRPDGFEEIHPADLA
jgi:phosphatidylserine/phosphatidylglycerophosphate/cardiolipin synthase-like enzyme